MKCPYCGNNTGEQKGENLNAYYCHICKKFFIKGKEYTEKEKEKMKSYED